ncbi:DUF1232 domain-containing protein [Paenibacillus sp.]|uniref:YkvA family protein n=1 Tax=Paenibacillus sp. TaxID=58172 RepID=UPI002810CF54|nr:DUF1232 domain-containing protein [Paenibacillus sp.]
MDKLRAWAKRLKRQSLTLYFAARRSDTPWYAKAVAAAVVAYAFSPIDLIPDFIPVLGLLDDVVLVPLGVWLALRLVPDAVLRECREEAERRLAEGGRKPVSRVGALFVGVAWIVCAAALAVWLLRRF